MKKPIKLLWVPKLDTHERWEQGLEEIGMLKWTLYKTKVPGTEVALQEVWEDWEDFCLFVCQVIRNMLLSVGTSASEKSSSGCPP